MFMLFSDDDLRAQSALTSFPLLRRASHMDGSHCDDG